LCRNQNYLPFNDESKPEEIHEYFGMSKKTFKMAVGALYKQKKIGFAKKGIQRLDPDDDQR
jgi:predicted RNA-binding protein (virulence factor B family)